ncbi:hypothetical protein K449DRAFT_382745 [Hypoxylon sp. EC38]|nr:hypothetical protein K449DRAFT_382745 [Hypoxylon sp. EC38]
MVVRKKARFKNPHFVLFRGLSSVHDLSSERFQTALQESELLRKQISFPYGCFRIMS